MSTFYDDASLVVIPSGYKTSKVYAEKPTDGSGDLAFTRTGDTATRVNSAGLIEKVRTNVLLQSQTFDNASWLKSLVGGASAPVVTANNTTAPDGTLTADKIVFVAPTSGDISHLTQSITVTGIANGSVYLKAFAAGDVGKILAVRFNTASYGLVTLTADWQRFSVSQTAIVGTFDIALRPAVGSSSGTVSVYAWGAQLETGDIATDYIATTTAAVSVGPTANTARLDYLGSTCPRLILEPQRQNALLQSETLNSATWTKDGGSVTANAVASPDGYTNADLFTEDTSTGNHRVYQNSISTSANQPVTFSVFAKYNGRQYVYLRMDVVSPKTAVFDIQNGTAGTVSSGASSKIENYGNGWYRLILTVDALAGNAAVCEGLLGFLSGSSFSNASYTGNGTAGAYLWGFQGEANAPYATSLIPTLAASATRGADACSKTGISSLIGQTEGTLFAEFTIPTMANTGANLVSISLFNSGITNVTLFDIYDSGNLFAVHVNGTAQASIQKTSFTAGRHKVAFGYKANDFVLYVDGVLVGTDTSGTVGAQDSFGLQYGTSQFIGQQYVNQALLFKTRLTNAELATLTTL